MDLSVLLKGASSLKHAIWVAKEGSRHMDWTQLPDGIGSAIEVAEWHETVEDRKAPIFSSLPDTDPKIPPRPLVAFWPNLAGNGNFVEYSSGVSSGD